MASSDDSGHCADNRTGYENESRKREEYNNIPESQLKCQSSVHESLMSAENTNSKEPKRPPRTKGRARNRDTETGRCDIDGLTDKFGKCSLESEGGTSVIQTGSEEDQKQDIYTGLGAIPKGRIPPALAKSTRDVYAGPSLTSTGPQIMKEWKMFKITYHIRETRINDFAFPSCPVSFMQFLCLYHLHDITKDIPEIDKKDVEKENGVLHIYLSDSCNDKKVSEVHDEMEKIAVSKQLMYKPVPLKNESEKEMKIKLEKYWKSAESGAFAVFQRDGQKSPFVIVGFKDHVQEFVRKLDEVESASIESCHNQTISISSKGHLKLLQELDFQKYLSKKHQDCQSIVLEYDEGKCCIHCHCSQNQQKIIDEEMDIFFSEVKSRELDIHLNLIKLLENRATHTFVKGHLAKWQVYGMWRIDSGKLKVYANMKDIERVTKEVNNCLVHMQISVDDPKYFFLTTASFSKIRRDHEESTLIVDRKLKSTDIFTTSKVRDAIEEGLKDLENSDCIPVTNIQLKAMEKFHKKPKDLKNQFPNSDINIQRESVKILCKDPSKRSRDAVKKHLTQFFSLIHALGTCHSMDTELLKKKEASEFLDKEIKLLDLQVVWEIETDNSIEILSLCAEHTEKAIEIFRKGICQCDICFTDSLRGKLEGPNYRKMEKKHRGKFCIQGINQDQEKEGILYGTSDIFNEIENFISCKESKNDVNEDKHEKIYPMSPDMLKHFEVNLKDLVQEIHCDTKELVFDNSQGIVIRGSKKAVNRALGTIEDYVKTKIWQDVMIVRNALELDYLLANSKDFELRKGELEKSNSCVISKETIEPKLGYCWFLDQSTVPDYFRICHIIGNAELIDTDVLLCPCSRQMFPAIPDIFETGGETFKKDSVSKSYQLAENENNYLKVGSISEISTATGNLNCWTILYCVTYDANKKSKPNMKTVIHDALRQADLMEMKSISIPMVLLPDEDIEIVEKQVESVLNAFDHPPHLRHLQEVYLCDPSNDHSKKIVQMLKKKKYSYLDFNILNESALDISFHSRQGARILHCERINIEIRQESLVSQKVDVLVNSVGPELDLKAGKVSNTILTKGGQSIQEELEKNHPSGINFAEVAITKAGNLRNCTYIFHGALIRWHHSGKFCLKVLKLFIWNCLLKADNLQCSSLAFPSLGTGKLEYPWRLVGETFFETIMEYEKHYKNTRIQHVILALHYQDHNSCMEFFAVEKQINNISTHYDEFPESFTHLRNYEPLNRIYLLPNHIAWKWGTLLKVAFDDVKAKQIKDAVWCAEGDCFEFYISHPSFTSSFFRSPLEKVLVDHRICTVEFSLQRGEPSYEKQIENFISLMKKMTHSVNYLMIVFPLQADFEAFMKNNNHLEKWKTRRKCKIPVALTIIGNPEDGPVAKRTLRSILNKHSKEQEAAKLSPDRGKDSPSQDSNLDGFVMVEEEELEAEPAIFETVTGNVHFANEISRDEIAQVVKSAGCTFVDDGPSCIKIQGNYKAIIKANDKVKDLKTKRTKSAPRTVHHDFVFHDEMNEDNFKAFEYFGYQYPWYKEIANKLEFTKGKLSVTVQDEKMKEEIKKHLDNVKMMNIDVFELKGVGSQKAEAIIQEVQQEHKNVCLFLKNGNITIISSDYGATFKVKAMIAHKISGKVPSSRAARRFQSGTPEETLSTSTHDHSNRRNRFKTSLSSGEVDLSRSVGPTVDVSATDLKTKEGIIVKVYEESILRVKVNCIVNAANDKLMHGGGVAAAISDAAGYDFDQESADYIAKHGPIPVGKCCITSAGKLPYKCVIHTVGPRWHDYSYDDKQSCLDDLQEAVEVTFREADKHGMSSIAIPAISSGIFAVPRDKCVEQYYRAVTTFSSSYKHSNLREIHFVDRDSTMISMIKSAFSKIPQNEVSLPERREITETLPFQKSNAEFSHTVPANQSSTLGKNSNADRTDIQDSVVFKPSEHFTIHFFIGDISKANAKAVICPQDRNCLSLGRVANHILNNTSDRPSAEPPISSKGYKMGDVIVVPVKKSSKTDWQYILHTVSPRWCKEATGNAKGFEYDLCRTTSNILDEAEKCEISSIAMPLLGAGTDDTYQTPLETCAHAFATSVKHFSNNKDLNHLKEVNVVFRSKSDKYAYSDAMQSAGFEIHLLSLPSSPQGQSMKKSLKISTASFQRNVENEKSLEEENCCICMDTPRNPKKLKKCGHIFCTECIDGYFQYKPVCPSCGQLYGKMTGDQPPGSMTIRKLSQKLPGYYNCDGSILVTYWFPDGFQGEDHPNPGQKYKGIERSGYIPVNKKGKLVAKLLNVAFSRKLVFTIGRSRTTGHDGVITWNDIHHKTRPEGGPQRFGYPDDTYLDRVMEEMAVKGVTPESADDKEEFKEYTRCFPYD